MKTKILFVNYTDDISGSSVALYRLIQTLNGSIDFQILGGKNSYLHGKAMLYKWQFIPCPVPKLKRLSPRTGLKFLRTYFGFSRVYKKSLLDFSPHYVFVNCLPNIAPAIIPAKKKTPPLVWWIHELELNPSWVKNLLISRVSQRADHIFCVSSPVMALFKKKKNKGLLYNIIPTRKGKVEDVSLKKELNLLWVGTISPRKGLLEFAKLVRVIAAAFPNVQVEIVGSLLPQYRDYYETCQKEIMAVLPDAVFRLNLPENEVPYRSDKILIQTSTLAESFSLPVAEAMSHGMVVFAPLRGGLLDYGKHLVNMVHYEIQAELLSHLLSLTKDAGLAAKIQNEALQCSRNFSEKRALEMFWKVIR